jgi:hypothetical protein
VVFEPVEPRETFSDQSSLLHEENRLLTFRDLPPPRWPAQVARASVVLWEAMTYTRSARTIRRFWKVGIGVHVCNVSMSLPLTCPITHTAFGSVMNTSLTRYL